MTEMAITGYDILPKLSGRCEYINQDARIFFVPVAPSNSNTDTSPSETLIAHLSHTHPSQPQFPYHVDHRLFVDTSSLLPQSLTKSSGQTTKEDRRRQYTHILATSHDASHTFVGTTSSISSAPSTGLDSELQDLAIISIPSQSTDQFSILMNTKLQPQWAHRQSMLLNGVRFDLPESDTESWSVCIGDLRSIGSGAGSKAGPGAGSSQIRGVIIELQYRSEEDKVKATDDDLSFEETRRYENMFQEMLKKLFHGTRSGLKLEEAKVVLKRTKTAKVTEKSSNEKVYTDKPQGWELAVLYMEVLRGMRG